MTILGNLLHFGQLFKVCGNNYLAQIGHILCNFCKDVKMFHFWVTFIDIWRLFTGHTGLGSYVWLLEMKHFNLVI